MDRPSRQTLANCGRTSLEQDLDQTGVAVDDRIVNG
jgi:hypothetical protein